MPYGIAEVVPGACTHGKTSQARRALPARSRMLSAPHPCWFGSARWGGLVAACEHRLGHAFSHDATTPLGTIGGEAAAPLSVTKESEQRAARDALQMLSSAGGMSQGARGEWHAASCARGRQHVQRSCLLGSRVRWRRVTEVFSSVPAKLEDPLEGCVLRLCTASQTGLCPSAEPLHLTARSKRDLPSNRQIREYTSYT